MTSGRLLIKGGMALAPDGSSAPSDILISNGIIEKVGRIQDDVDAGTIDAGDCLVVPGLVNAHFHSGENFNPGQFENLPLDVWFVHSHEVTRSAPPDPDLVYLRTLLGAILMLRSGTTSVVDFLYEAPRITHGTLEAVVRAYKDAGLRATVVLGFTDKPFLDSLPVEQNGRTSVAEAPPPTKDEILRLCDEAIDRWHEPNGMIRVGLGPSAPQRCTPELLKASKDLADRREVIWHTHVLETRTQAYTGLKWHGTSLLQVMHRQELLGPRTALVHAVWLSDQDVQLLSNTHTSVVHCLMSNLRLGDGVARMPALRRAGVTIALGTDGRGCDESLDMLELTKMTALIHKVRGDPYDTWPTAREVLDMATSNGSRVSGYEDRLGRIEPGTLADLVLVDLKGPGFVPQNDLVRQLVYGAPHLPLKAVIVGGRVVCQDGRMTTVDAESVMKQVRAKDLKGAPIVQDVGTRELEDSVRRLWQKAERSDVGVDAYIR